MEKKYQLSGLDCANCAAKIEKAVTQLDHVKTANVDFVQTKLTIEAANQDFPTIETEMKAIVNKLEPDVVVKDLSKNQAEDQHDHQHDEINRQEIYRLVISAALFGTMLILKPTGLPAILAYLIIYILTGGDVIKRAVSNVFRGEIFDENFLMSVATIGAFLIGEYPEAVAVMLFYQIGEFFQSYAVNRSRKSISALMDIRPDAANLVKDGRTEVVHPSEINIGDTILVKPGEKVPLDGVVEEGSGFVDTSALTGESVPRKIQTGEEILSGFINQDGMLTIKVTRNFAESTVSKILDLVENASSKKAPAENFITKFARYYTPIVVGLAILLAVIPPLVTGDPFGEWIYRALTFLVISCPCALVISVPLSFFGGIGGASKLGILIKGSNFLELLAQVDTVVMDKTGTLTKGSFAVQEIQTDMDQKEFLQFAASAEQHSTHPIGRSILASYQGELLEIEEMKEIAGHGIEATIAGHNILIGNDKLFTSKIIPEVSAVGTIIYMAVDGSYAGYLVIADEIKADAKETIQELKKLGVSQVIMLTGDNQKIGQAVGKTLGVDQVYADLLPEDKVTHLEEAIQKSATHVAFVGDGINDAPVLARADVGIAMGGLGSDAAIEAADVVIMNDEPKKIAQGIQISRKTLRIVKENIIFALAVKIIVLVLGALGYATMVAAVFADVGVTLLAVLNALRCLQVKKIQ